MGRTLLSGRLRVLLNLPDSRSFRCERSREAIEAGFSVHRLCIVTDTGTIPSTLLQPEMPNGAAILYCHAHGNRPDIGRAEVLIGRPAIGEPFGSQLARCGFAVLCADMPGFGERQGEGSESALVKAAQWRGETLMGRMLSDLILAVDALAGIDGVDADRIGAFGLSMGATHAYWLAALDRRIAAVAHACAFSDMSPLIDSGAHDLHGHYMTVPGFLAIGDMGDVAASIAPRPQFIASGADDPLTPQRALGPALHTASEAYGAHGDLTILTEAGSGHRLTPRMRRDILAFFDRTLARPA